MKGTFIAKALTLKPCKNSALADGLRRMKNSMGMMKITGKNFKKMPMDSRAPANR